MGGGPTGLDNWTHFPTRSRDYEAGVTLGGVLLLLTPTPALETAGHPCHTHPGRPRALFILTLGGRKQERW